MLKEFDVLQEIISGVISIVIGMPTESGIHILQNKFKKIILSKKIKQRADYLLNYKYKEQFDSLNEMTGEINNWLKEKGTIKRMLSFYIAEDSSQISCEQLLYAKELFYAEAFQMADCQELKQKNLLRNILSDLMQFIDDLFWKSINEENVFLYKKVY